MKNKNKICYNTVMKQLNNMDNQIKCMKEQIQQLRSRFVIEEHEVCQDEIDADRAAFDAISDICLDALLDIEPKGDA
jgi:hypothetical protein|tara:strand:- start:184 stop:414 length:231 start_codon:yes stop_codon:yes gene_type:complete